jgi:N-acetyl-anhydromuramyl-L-alanine amidase AmpD
MHAHQAKRVQRNRQHIGIIVAKEQRAAQQGATTVRLNRILQYTEVQHEEMSPHITLLLAAFTLPHAFHVLAHCMAAPGDFLLCETMAE